MQTIPFSAPMSLGQLLDRAFRLYRVRFRKLVLTAALFFVPLAMVSALLMGTAFNSYFGLLLSATEQPAAFDERTVLQASGVTLALSLVVGLFGLILGAFAFLSLLAQADANALGRELSIAASVRTALSRFWPFVGMSLLTGLIAAGIAIVAYLIFFILIFIFAGVLTALGGALESDSVVVAVGAVILIIALFFGLMFLLLLPLAYLTTRWLVAPVVIMTELKGPVDALKRSWRLTEGSFWRLFGLLVLLFILNGIVLALPLSLIQFIAFAVTPSQMFGLLNGALSGLSNLLSILWYPLLALTLTLVYYDLRVRKENYDLELRIQALEASARPSNPSTP
ncbi:MULTISPECIES: glycerophosphoryl diester phosphodiesterase membrane domain-containing protein [Caldilinea]|jgi:hypothetical protein|nr:MULTISPECIES: glycerophosphoryl diester phosphodiesterase membrane domain-containing protein [Caldilinea]GIV73819.1 MAG: hypothetical protein KatS3mg049_2375 [Caldilinea sp.]